MKGVGEPCAGEPHARFDGRGLETERYGVTAPAPDPTMLSVLSTLGQPINPIGLEAISSLPYRKVHRVFQITSTAGSTPADTCRRRRHDYRAVLDGMRVWAGASLTCDRGFAGEGGPGR